MSPWRSIAPLAAPAVADGWLTGPMMALLVLLPLALADVALPLADAGALSVRTAAADDRLRALERTAPAVRDTVADRTPSGHDVAVERVRARWAPGGALTAELSVRPRAGRARRGRRPVGRRASPPWPRCCCASSTPPAGTVTLGGCDPAPCAWTTYAASTGLVDDDPHVFATTLVENVRLARPGPPTRRSRPPCAGRGSATGSTTSRTGCTPGSATATPRVSGGERARIGVARSLLADQPVLVLDEPAAHLDSATAAELAREVLTGDRDRSVLWITHGTAGLDLVDRVVDLAAPARGPIHR